MCREGFRYFATLLLDDVEQFCGRVCSVFLGLFVRVVRLQVANAVFDSLGAKYSGRAVVKVLLEFREDSSDFFWPPKVRHSIGNRIVVFKPK